MINNDISPTDTFNQYYTEKEIAEFLNKTISSLRVDSRQKQETLIKVTR